MNHRLPPSKPSRQNSLLQRSAKLALVALCLLAITAAVAAAPVSVEAKADKTEVTVGDLIQYTITITADTGLTVTAPDAKADTRPFEVRDYKAAAPRSENGKSVTDITYSLAVYQTGVCKLDKLKVTYRDAAGKDTQVPVPPLSVTVKSVLPPGAQDIKDIRGPVPVKAGAAQWVIGVLLGLIIAAAIAYAVYRYTHRKPKAAAPAPAVLLQDWELAIKELDALREVALTSDDEIKAFYVRITDIVRAYLIKRYRISAREETTSLIYYHLRKHAEASARAGEFRDLLAACDLVKFAKYRPQSHEAFQALDWATKVILNSRRIPVTPPVADEVAAVDSKGTEG